MTTIFCRWGRATVIACLFVAGMGWNQALVADESPRLDLDLSFSKDGGKSFTKDFPVLENPGVVKVRANWSNPRPSGESDVYTSTLYCEQSDFASAHTGKQAWEPTGWYQRPTPYYLGADAPAQFDYDLDVGARPEGATGFLNRWDPQAKKQVDAPLPACPALGNGSHKFTLRVAYSLKNVTPNRRVEGRAAFMLTIGGSATSAPTTQNAGPVASVEPFDLQTIELGNAGWSFTPAQAQLIGGAAPKLAKDGQTATLGGATELRWLLKDVPKGSYYVGLVLSERAHVYNDGNFLVFATTRKPGQVEEKVWLAEHLSSAPISVEDGTEVRIKADGASLRVGRLALYRQAPARGPVDVAEFPHPWRADKLRATARIAPGRAGFTVSSVLTRPVPAKISARVLDYFQQVVAEEEREVLLQPRQPVEQELRFVPGDSQQYRMEVQVTSAEAGDVVASAEYLSDRSSSHRGKMWLNGTWDFAGLGLATELQLPAGDAAWQKAVVPGPSPEFAGKKQACGWFRRTFTVPADLPGSRRALVFDSVNYEAVVVLNGQEVGRHMGWQAGFAIDVTDKLKEGENELMVGVRNGISALTPEAKASGNLSGNKLWPGAGNQATVGDVSLESYPQGGLDNVAVRPSFRNKRLDLEIALRGTPAEAVTLRNTVYYRGKPVLRFDDTKLAAGQTGPISLSQAWPDPVLWGLFQPNLLRLDSELLNDKGERVDLVQTRFGFREFWPEGTRLMLNGQAMNFRAFAMNNDGGVASRMTRAYIRGTIRDARACQGTMERHIYSWANHPDVADEEGMPLACAITGEANPTQFKFECDEFWEHAESLAAQRVQQLRNHPSIVEWYLSNEFTECSPDPVLATKRMVGVRDVVAKADPTRICEAGCDLDLRGALNIICTHYPVDLGGLRIKGTYLPDVAMWYMPGQSLKPGMKVPAGLSKGVANVRGESPFVWGVKPLIINEYGWVYFYRPLYGLTTFTGDEVFRGPEALKLAHKQANAWFGSGHRDAEASILTPWHHYSAGAMAYTLPALDIFPFTRSAQWYRKTKVNWQVDVFHDTGTPEQLTFQWELIDRQAKQSLATGKQDAQFEAYGVSRQSVSFVAPSVPVDVDCELRLLLMDGQGRARLEKRFAARVAAARRWQPKTAVRLGVFDPGGKSSAALSNLGVQAVSLNEPSAAALAKLDVLVLGEESGTDPSLIAHGSELAAFVEAGGRVLSLHQTRVDRAWFPVECAPVADHVASIMFRRSANHPILQGMSDEDLRFWYPDHITARNAFIKPASANVLPILDCGNATLGLNLAALMEVRRGKGRMLLSQLVFSEQAGQCPPADRLVFNMLDYLAAATSEATSVQTTAVLTAANSPLERALKRLGAEAEFRPDKKTFAGFHVVILDQSAEVDATVRAELRRYIEAGGTMIFHNASPKQRTLLQELTGQTVRVTTPTPPGFAGRMILYHNDRLTEGLSNQDLFWNRQPDGEDPYPCFSAKQSRIDEVLSCAYEAEGSVALGYPAGLVQVPLGKGKVYLDGVRWDAATGAVAQTADRIAYTMLANVGVGFRARKPAARLTGLEYFPIDLTAHLNRSLADDVADDGKGGWSDQGPRADMRKLPTGRQVFAGVPLDVATPNGCIVLASKYRPGSAPQAVTGMKVGRTADALYFLQSAAWISPGLHATYRIHYADGATTDIPLEGDVNYRDWSSDNPQEPFSSEIGTFTQVGWTGSTPQFPKVSAFVMQWTNPRPEVAIESLDFIGANNGVAILVGVTAGARPAAAQTDLKAGDRAQAQALDEQARAAIAVGDKAQGMKLARAALAQDATYVPARVRLAALLEDAGDKRQAEAELRQVIAIDPQHLESYLWIGRLCEESNRDADALEVYNQGLRGNPNQPGVVQAIERLRRRGK